MGSCLKKKYRADRTPAYLCVLGSAVITFVNGGLARSNTLIYEKLIDTFGESKAGTAWVFGFHGLVSWVFVGLTTYLATRFGCRRTVIVGGIIKALGVAMCVYTPSLPYMYFSYGFLAALGMTMTWDSIFIVLTQHFQKQKGCAMGLASTGSALGGIVLAPLIQILFEQYGYAGAMLILGALSLNACVGGALLSAPRKVAGENNIPLHDMSNQLDTNTKSKDINADDSQSGLFSDEDNAANKRHDEPATPSKLDPLYVSDSGRFGSTNLSIFLDEKGKNDPDISKSSLKDRLNSKWQQFRPMLGDSCYVTFAISMALHLMTFTIMTTFLAGLAAERGISRRQTALILSISSGVDFAARLFSGVLFDLRQCRERRGYVYCSVAILYCLVTALLPMSTSFPLFTVHFAVVCILLATSLSHLNTVTGDLVGADRLPHAMGINGLFQGTGSTVGPLIGGFIRDQTGSYYWAYVCGGIIGVVGNMFFFSALVIRSLRTRTQDNHEVQ